MPKLSIAPRAKLVGFVALASAMVLNGSLARPDAAFGRVHVDVTSLRAEVGDPKASRISEELPGALAQALASVGRAGAPVTVRTHTVILGPSSGGQGPNNTSPDQIIGEVIIDGVARPLCDHELLSDGGRPSAR